MSYTVKDLAQISGVSVETLQYYDEIGLVQPNQLRSDGYPYYNDGQLLELQQVMLYREYGLPLNEIKILMGQEQDETDMLMSHKERLIEKQMRIQKLVDTIDYTMEFLEQGNQVEHRRLYEGFDLAIQGQYLYRKCDSFEDEPKSPTQDSQMKSQQKWSKDDYLNTQREADQIYVDLCDALEKGEDPSSPSVQKVIKRHYVWISHFYTPTKEIYIGLGDLYVDHEDFKQLYAGYHPELARFLRDGMKFFADQQM